MGKNKILIVFLLIINALTAFSQNQESKWYALPDGTGYIDIQGDILNVERKLMQAYPFSDGMARVAFADNYQSGLIDETGSVILEGKILMKMGNYSSGYALIEYDMLDYNFIDKNGDKVFDNNVYYLQRFSDGLALISKGKNEPSIVIDNKFHEVFVVPEEFAIDPFSNGLAVIKKINRKILHTDYGYIDKTGKVLVYPYLYWAEDFSEDVAVVNRNQFINKKGEFIFTDLDISLAKKFSDGMCRVIKDDRIGYIDKSGRIVIEPVFTSASDFIDGYAVASMANKAMGNEVFDFDQRLVDGALWGIIDKTGAWVIEPEYRSINLLGNNVANLSSKDSNGNWLSKLIVLGKDIRVLWEKEYPGSSPKKELSDYVNGY